jgi:hypothetical protein
MPNIVPLPLTTPLIERSPKGELTGIITKQWADVLQNILGRSQNAATVTTSVGLSGQTATIATANLIAAAPAGVYRLTWFVHVTTPASVNSGIQITLGWVHGGVALTKVGGANAGNLNTTYETQSILIRNDNLGNLTYAAAYASTGTPMIYSLDIICERVA